MTVTAKPASPPPSIRRMGRRALRLLRPHRRRVVFLTATIFAAAALGVAAPVLTKLVFDRALFPPSGEPDLGLLGVLFGIMVVLIALASAAGILQTYLATVIGQLVMHDLRNKLYRHVQRMSMRFFTGTRGGEIQSRIGNDIGGVGNVVSKSALTVVSNVVFLVASLIAMAVLTWELALLSLAVIPVFAYLSMRVGRMTREVTASAQRTLAEMTSITQETLSVSGALLTKVFGRERHGEERYDAESRRLADLRVRQEMVGRVFMGLAQTFFLIGPAITYLVAGLAMSGGSDRYTPGTLVAIAALQVRLFVPLRDLLQSSVQLQSSAALFERIFEYLDLPHEIVDSPRARPIPKGQARGAIALDGVHFRYLDAAEPAGSADGGRPWTLENVSLEIKPGQLAALVGPTGAGKTTLSYLIARLYDVQRGSVLVDGIDVREIRLASLGEIIGMVTQETYLFNASIRENLLYARLDATQEEIEAAARLAFIHDRIMQLEDGYDTMLGERGYRMSGGEKQRLAIARATLKDPRILILDEATSSLDSESERLVQEALEPVMAGRTTVAIAHRLSTIVAADVIFVLDHGRLVEQGTHAELVGAGGLYSRLYERQFGPGAARAGELPAPPGRRLFEHGRA
jgi:ATP-binding cassette subfamily B protein